MKTQISKPSRERSSYTRAYKPHGPAPTSAEKDMVGINRAVGSQALYNYNYGTQNTVTGAFSLQWAATDSHAR
jgi:hypothetical protein